MLLNKVMLQKVERCIVSTAQQPQFCSHPQLYQDFNNTAYTIEDVYAGFSTGIKHSHSTVRLIPSLLEV